MLNAKQAAAQAGISLSLLYALCIEGRLKHRRVGRTGGRGKYLISEADLDEFLRQCEVSGPPRDEGELKHVR